MGGELSEQETALQAARQWLGAGAHAACPLCDFAVLLLALESCPLEKQM